MMFRNYLRSIPFKKNSVIIVRTVLKFVRENSKSFFMQLPYSIFHLLYDMIGIPSYRLHLLVIVVRFSQITLKRLITISLLDKLSVLRIWLEG